MLKIWREINITKAAGIDSLPGIPPNTFEGH